MTARRLWTLACALGLALAVAACGQTSDPPSDLNNGVYVFVGPITYQMQVSRELNQYATEDKQYLAGLPAGTDTLTPDQLWYGVFLWAKNQTDKPQTTASKFTIVDSSGNVYHPIALDSQVNGYAWTSQVLQPAEIEPELNTTASFGPTGGGLLLFKLPNSVYANRPLTLNIYPAGGGKPGQISLDL
ncbi:MAG TPA: hypothetical protein VMA77_21070 [Solirubrobacteraceae bacterium]|nr:hypothetical protein [Solirubrobacteraceae bacterium]